MQKREQRTSKLDKRSAPKAFDRVARIHSQTKQIITKKTLALLATVSFGQPVFSTSTSRVLLGHNGVGRLRENCA